jgi:SAM-dependent methyltransferase
MRSAGWDRETIRKLPEDQSDGYWFVQATGLEQVYDAARPAPGEWLLDVGSNTCWASNRFARRGLNVIALDIATTEMQGLYTADYFIDDGETYFERVLATMYNLPIASSSLDYVYCCEVLHHNDPPSLRRTFKEIYRVLKPGGKLFVVNETIKTLSDPIGNHNERVEQFEGYEHAFWTWQYRWEAAAAGLRRQQMLPPRYHWFYDPRTPPPKPGNGPLRRANRLLRTTRPGHKAFLAWLNQIRGGVQMTFIATKPADATAP